MSEVIPAEAWMVDVGVRITALRNVVKEAEADPARAADPRARVAAAAVEGHLAKADRAIKRGRWPQRGLVSRWRGTSIALAYQNLHAAEVFLVDLMTPDQLFALVPSVVARARAVLDPLDPRRTAVDQLPRLVADRLDDLRNNRAPEVRTAIQQAMSLGYDATDQMHVRIRNFRNLVISSAVVIIILMAALVLMIWDHPGEMPFCFSSTQPTPSVPNPPLDVCPSGMDHPTGRDVLIVAGLGLLGGALGAAFSIRNVRGTSTPYDVPVALALLKLPLGALTAVAGILLLGGDFFPGLSQLDSQRQILAYALVLGFGQQLVSRLIDQQAQTVLNALPGTDPEGKQPVPPATTMPVPPAQPPEASPSPMARLWKAVSRRRRT